MCDGFQPRFLPMPRFLLLQLLQGCTAPFRLQLRNAPKQRFPLQQHRRRWLHFRVRENVRSRKPLVEAAVVAVEMHVEFMSTTSSTRDILPGERAPARSLASAGEHFAQFELLLLAPFPSAAEAAPDQLLQRSHPSVKLSKGALTHTERERSPSGERGFVSGSQGRLWRFGTRFRAFDRICAGKAGNVDRAFQS
eukprot:scaffold4027_cov245-Pinguiococcus_pyrenoidosus.AAC.6